MDIFDGIEENNYDGVKEILEYDRNKVNSRNNYWYTPLHYASFIGNLEMCRLLLNNGTDSTIKNEYGKTALDYAIERKNTFIVTLFQNYEKMKILWNLYNEDDNVGRFLHLFLPLEMMEEIDIMILL